MSLRSKFRLRASAVTVALGLVVGSATTVFATETEADPRAQRHEGNATTCAAYGGGMLVGYGGDAPVENTPTLTFEGGQPEKNTYLTITGIPEAVEVTAVVIKGGPDHNVYVPGTNGMAETPEWKRLRAPVNRGGQVPTISHWFACGEEVSAEASAAPQVPSTSRQPSTTRKATSSAPLSLSAATTAPSSEEVPVGSTGTEAPSSRAVGTEVTSVSASGDLASTGFSGGWLLGLGAVLLLTGGALLVLVRLRRDKS